MSDALDHLLDVAAMGDLAPPRWEWKNGNWQVECCGIKSRALMLDAAADALTERLLVYIQQIEDHFPDLGGSAAA